MGVITGEVVATTVYAGETLTVSELIDPDGINVGVYDPTGFTCVGTATGTVSVTVSNLNDPPVAVADALYANEDILLAVAAAVVLFGQPIYAMWAALVALTAAWVLDPAAGSIGLDNSDAAEITLR